jgi:hypothetical protein
LVESGSLCRGKSLYALIEHGCTKIKDISRIRKRPRSFEKK